MENTGIWTLSKIASAIRNNLEAGMKTTSNFAFSLEQLQHEIIAERAAIVKQLELAGTLDKKHLLQEINCIELDCEDLALCCNANSGDNIKHFVLPIYTHIDFIGSDRMSSSIKTYQDSSFVHNKYRDKRLTHRPYILLRPVEGKIHGFYFNPPSTVTKYLSVSAIFTNPIEVNLYSCCNYDINEDRFPAPDFIIQQIITGITSRWASMYYRFQGSKPNTQSPII